MYNYSLLIAAYAIWHHCMVPCSNNNLFLLSYDFYYMSFMFVNLLDEYFVCLRVSTGTIFYLSLFSNVLLFYAE